MCTHFNVSARQEPEATRSLWDSEFLQKRPKATKPQPTKSKLTTIRYKRKETIAAATSTSSKPESTQVVSSTPSRLTIGVTAWRLRPAKVSDDKAVRLLERTDDTDSQRELTPERIDLDTPLEEGQKIRLSIEVPRSGYLYVIDREKYADGTVSEPYLIFPVLRGGKLENNQVKAGVLVDIPGDDDPNPYFKVTRSGPAQVGEVLTLLIAPAPLAELKIGNKIQKLPAEQFASWEKQWSTQVEMLELVDGSGNPITKEEKIAGTGGRILTRDDPPPQTLYSVTCQPNTTVMVPVTLKLGK
ncbi:MAG TPA: hypothetical protein PLB18_11325 [Acidobacteriota bacterium]|nr:hypothetical protein [Acidobacteriota bacterium]HNB71074.1 hypothetical protein [Acidobacteriota bacterium]HND19960.1 hypothetical protein [Acidobacteriota bacterium]HNH82701.1 hypothetical protein [Acidobacteriota bacterium]